MEALVYDSLKEQGKEITYVKVAANFETVNWSAWAISAIGGGYLYFWQYQSPWLIQAAMFVVAAEVAVKLVEPKIDSVKVRLGDIFVQPIQGFKELFYTRKIGIMTLQLVVIGAGYIIASNILGASQAREYGFDARGTGWIFGIGCIFSVIASRYFVTIKNWLGENRLVVVTAMMMLLSFLVARYVGIVAGSALIVLRIASSSTFRNTRTVIANEWISSKNRATALSTLSLLTQIPYILLSPLFGLMIDRTSPNQFSWWLGLGILTILGLTQLVRVKRIV
jgi:MFS superfamily sulfate permease-like transporter